MGVRTLNRIIWTCFTRVRLVAYIVGLVLAIDASVLLHAILSDEIVSQVRQGTESITGEVFQFCNLWYVNKGLGNAKQLFFVFDGDLARKAHCDLCQAQATQRLAEKDAVAGAERAEARRSADAKFNEVLQAANKMVQDGVLVDEKLLALKRTELDALFKKGASRSACVRAALLFWIVQHNNHLYRDADGVGGTAGGGKDENKKKAKVQRATVEEKRRGNTYDVKRKNLKRCPITIFMARGEADDSMGALCQQGIIDAVVTVDGDLILWECPVIILKGTTDRRKQENHLVSVVTEAAVLAHIRNVLVNADDPSQAWRQQLKFDEWRQQQRDLVGPKGKAIKKQAAPKKKQAGAAAAAAAAVVGATTDSGTAVAPARKKRQTGLAAGAAAAAAAAAAGGLARKAPARLELPFKLDRANMAALLATPAAARTALRVLSSFLGTDFVHGALNPFAAVSYTAWWVHAGSATAREDVVRAAFAAGTMNRKTFAGMMVEQYVGAFNKAVAHFEKPFDVSMSTADWHRFLLNPPPVS